MTTTDDIVRPLSLTVGLIARFWPQLLLLGAIGYVARDLLLNAAVTVGLVNPLGGMVVLSLVVLTKLLVIVAMFVALRPGLPALASLRQMSASGAKQEKTSQPADHLLAVTAAAILPFFAYYAAWGFLGDSVREYSRLALERIPLGESADIFGLLRSSGLIASIVGCWLVRWFAKRMNKGARRPYWRLLVVAADASWIFIGLYAFDIWKDEFITWIGASALRSELSMGAGSLVLSIAAHAAEGFTPVEFRQPGILEQAQSLFFYALLPMVWLVMAAIINGYELTAASAAAAPPPSRGSTWRKWLSDFITHFLGGYRSRYAPIWACLKLTLGAGLATLLTFVVAYRLIGWLCAWLWFGATRTLGAPDLDTWQVVFSFASVFIGSPSDLDGGIVLDALRIALLAAVLEFAVAAQRQPLRVAT
ncbi:hypothetical protein NKI78_20390 [Mesorhizobium sp. M0400]|uniref:hypothetical protein n=1 Tax=Mesorhizobium sp. M0400 TaxID=2956941 RepID=UPI0033383FE9